MSRFPRLRRRPDQWPDPHQRARTRLAERLDGPLGLTETTWLDEHLAACSACAAIAAGYDADRAALRALRAQPPEPPRDLWARTAAAIEAAEADGAARRDGRERDVRRSLPLGALSGLAVVVIMVGVGLVSANLPLGGPTGRGAGEAPEILGVGSPSAPAGSPALAPGATPIAVDPFAVGWVEGGPDGVAGHQVSVDEVCPVENDADCPSVDATRRLSLDLTVTPRTIVASPSRRQAVAISETGDASDEVVVLALPQADDPEPTARASASAAPTSTPSASPTDPPSTTSTPTIGPEPSTGQTTPSPSAAASIEPSSTPAPTAARQLAIASGIRVVGQSAAFSPDGEWFAFTARPAAGPDGADVYVWHVGDTEARPLTDDGISYFASWVGGDLIASRPDDPTSDETDATSVRIDPQTGHEVDSGAGWRPAVDPSGRRAIVWLGTLTRLEDGTWAPADGRLELRRWSDDGPAEAIGGERRLVDESAPRDFDVRWDDTGAWVGVWVADRDDPVVGRLSLYHVDAERGRLERVDGAPADVAALPGFSIGDGRLAWATPRGQGGEGSRIQIAAWSKTDVGRVESSPGEDPVVIR